MHIFVYHNIFYGLLSFLLKINNLIIKLIIIIITTNYLKKKMFSVSFITYPKEKHVSSIFL